MTANTFNVPVPPAAGPHIREIDRLGLKYGYAPQFDLSTLDLLRRVQVRDVEHYAPQTNVQQYAASLKGGAEFPPLIVTADYHLVDGNTRLQALRLNGTAFFPVIVLTAAYKDASKPTENKLLALAATLNQLGAQRLTTPEAKAAAVYLLFLGWNLPNIQRALGLSGTAIGRIKKEQGAILRMNALGIIPPVKADLFKYGSTTMLSLNDEPFRRMVMLITDADLSVREIAGMAEAIRRAGSDQAAIDLIKTHRLELEDRIRENALTGVGKPSPAAQFRQALGHILRFEGREADAVEKGESHLEAHWDKLQRAQSVIDIVAGLQRDVADGA